MGQFQRGGEPKGTEANDLQRFGVLHAEAGIPPSRGHCQFWSLPLET